MERLKQRGFPPAKQDSGIHGNTVSGREAKRKEETPEIAPPLMQCTSGPL